MQPRHPKVPKDDAAVDNGSEFKGKTKQHFEKKNVITKYGLPGRSRQQAFAATRNQIIGKLTPEEQTNVELAPPAAPDLWEDK